MMAARYEASGGTGSARRRRERRLRAYLRFARMSVAMALAECQHHSAQHQKTARAREGVRDALHDQAPEEPPPQVVGRRHCGIGFELVLDTGVPQLERELDEEIVDIPVRAGLKRLRDLHGFLPGPGSTAQTRDARHGHAPAPMVDFVSPAPAARTASIVNDSCGLLFTCAGSVSVASASW